MLDSHTNPTVFGSMFALTTHDPQCPRSAKSSIQIPKEEQGSLSLLQWCDD